MLRTIHKLSYRTQEEPTVRVYYLPNLDGTRGTIVAAANQKEALKLIGTTAYSFRNYGGHRTSDAQLVELAMSEPGVVWVRKIDFGPTPQPWLRRAQFRR